MEDKGRRAKVKSAWQKKKGGGRGQKRTRGNEGMEEDRGRKGGGSNNIS